MQKNKNCRISLTFVDLGISSLRLKGVKRKGGGLRFVSLSPHPKTGLNPISGRCRERLPRKFGG